MDRLKFRYVFKKDFGGKTGICYKMPVFDLDETVRTEFEKTIKGYADYGYELVSKDQCTGKKDKNNILLFENDIIYKKGNKNYKKEKMYSKVIFDDMYAEFNISDEDGCHRMPSNSQNIEVVGNIYQNKELLNV
ncbi:YopX family protein [Candidatus Ruminimicrobiellum ovillum]|uniref:YopX family protein n=1 Tax=Candidatus Ruminimicrobiellum ovillum TaxID=1947927 RepID=UPI00355A02F8